MQLTWRSFPVWGIALIAPIMVAPALSAKTVPVRTLYTFSKEVNGYQPPLTLIQGTDGNFYGTIPYLGSTAGTGVCDGYACGMVFQLTSAGVLTPIYSFTGAADGAAPNSLIQGHDGNFYGTTQNGGVGLTCQYGCGTVFQLTPAGVLTTLYSFNYADGAYPSAGTYPSASLIQGSDGNLYGTTSGGGSGSTCASGCGTVFQLTLAGTLTTLHNFTDGADGAYPGVLRQGVDGNLYGAAQHGGSNAYGTIFKLNSDGALTTVYTFTDAADGATPTSLIQGSDGNLYGATAAGGSGTCVYGCGTVFKLTMSGVKTTLHRFEGTDGYEPEAGLIQGSDNNLYGTTQGGGNSQDLCQDGFTLVGCGTVFKLTMNGALTMLHSFSNELNGAVPAALIQATDGNLYGTTAYGGDRVSESGTSCSGQGCATIFKLRLP